MRATRHPPLIIVLWTLATCAACNAGASVDPLHAEVEVSSLGPSAEMPAPAGYALDPVTGQFVRTEDPGATGGPPDDAEVPRGARSLIGTRWFPAGDAGNFAEISFGESVAMFGQQDGTSVVFPADFSASLPGCFGYPLCVAVLTGGETPLQYWWFGRLDEYLVIADCAMGGQYDDREAWEAARSAALTEHAGFIVHESRASVCWHMGLVPYHNVPSWWEDEHEVAWREATIPEPPAVTGDGEPSLQAVPTFRAGTDPLPPTTVPEAGMIIAPDGTIPSGAEVPAPVAP